LESHRELPSTPLDVEVLSHLCTKGACIRRDEIHLFQLFGDVLLASMSNGMNEYDFKLK
jgi:hypothetical protein